MSNLKEIDMVIDDFFMQTELYIVWKKVLFQLLHTIYFTIYFTKILEVEFVCICLQFYEDFFSINGAFYLFYVVYSTDIEWHVL